MDNISLSLSLDDEAVLWLTITPLRRREREREKYCPWRLSPPGSKFDDSFERLQYILPSHVNFHQFLI